jgi:hypothetical protein
MCCVDGHNIDDLNLQYCLILTGMFRFKPASQFVEQYHNVVSCALNMEGLILNNFCKFVWWLILCLTINTNKMANL